MQGNHGSDHGSSNSHGSANTHVSDNGSSNAHGSSNSGSSHSSEHGSANNDSSHGSSSHGGEHSGNGDHHVPPPSYQLQPHSYSYKPEGFEMFQEPAGIKRIIVGFRYPTLTNYDRYVFRVRFHGQSEFSTNKMKLNRTGRNQLLLNKFEDAQYIVCVTLFSGSGLPNYPPVSTSDMCLDIFFGEAPHIGGHHASSGLLSPLLVAVAFVLHAYICIGTWIKEVFFIEFLCILLNILVLSYSKNCC
jgi:hypothetical protein